MIKELTEQDRQDVLDLVSPEKEVNLFIIGDLENFGFDAPEVKFWGQADDNGRLTAVLMLFYNSLIFYSLGAIDRDAFARIIQSQKARYLSGEKSILVPLEPAFVHSKRKDTVLCRLEKQVVAPDPDLDQRIRLATVEDLPAILDMLEKIEGFGDIEYDTDMLRDKIAKGDGRVYLLEEDGRLVSLAQTTAENSQSAMVVGVATRQGFRQRGYATACMSRLCGDLQAEGKSLCLFYDNPEAGRIYARFGFRKIGEWIMLIQ